MVISEKRRVPSPNFASPPKIVKRAWSCFKYIFYTPIWLAPPLLSSIVTHPAPLSFFSAEFPAEFHHVTIFPSPIFHRQFFANSQFSAEFHRAGFIAQPSRLASKPSIGLSTSPLSLPWVALETDPNQLPPPKSPTGTRQNRYKRVKPRADSTGTSSTANFST